jgi:hypothetical protein
VAIVNRKEIKDCQILVGSTKNQKLIVLTIAILFWLVMFLNIEKFRYVIAGVGFLVIYGFSRWINRNTDWALINTTNLYLLVDAKENEYFKLKLEDICSCKFENVSMDMRALKIELKPGLKNFQANFESAMVKYKNNSCYIYIYCGTRSNKRVREIFNEHVSSYEIYL